MNALFRKSVFRRFVPAVCAVALLATSLQAQKPLAVVSMNLLADLAVAALDPRARSR